MVRDRLVDEIPVLPPQAIAFELEGLSVIRLWPVGRDLGQPPLHVAPLRSPPLRDAGTACPLYRTQPAGVGCPWTRPPGVDPGPRQARYFCGKGAGRRAGYIQLLGRPPAQRGENASGGLRITTGPEAFYMPGGAGLLGYRVPPAWRSSLRAGPTNEDLRRRACPKGRVGGRALAALDYGIVADQIEDVSLRGLWQDLQDRSGISRRS